MWADEQFLRPFREAQRPARQSVRGFSQIGSFNWSGFAQGAPNGTYKSVVDTWTVPTVNTSRLGESVLV